MARRREVSLVLSAKTQNNWRATDPESVQADAEFRKIREDILERDGYACLGCGFRAPSWQEVHHVNDDHSDNSRGNLATVCQFCHMVQHIGLAGARDQAVLIWCPEIPQAHIHHIVRTALVADWWLNHMQQNNSRRVQKFQESVENISQGARNAMAALRARQEAARKKLYTSDPADLANILLDLSDDAYARRNDMLWPFRLLPTGQHIIDQKDRMPEIVESWVTSESGPYFQLRPTTWRSMLRN